MRVKSLRSLRHLAAAAIVASVSVLAGTATPASAADPIDPPAWTRRQATMDAKGVQIYRCQLDSTGNWAWTFVEPRATLYSPNFWTGPYGDHYAGPTWRLSIDGSGVVGQKVASKPSPDGSIPWLLLEAKSWFGGANGFFTKTTHIQRTNTTGGLAPSDLCYEINAWTVREVPYTARYTFYENNPAQGM